MSNPSHFFSCDWGTTTFRLRLVEMDSLRVAAERESTQGARELTAGLPAGAGAIDRARVFERTLVEHVLAMPMAESVIAAGAQVIVSGMASSSIGWRELPYAPLPFAVDGSQTRAERLTIVFANRQLPVLLVSGVASDSEMMRGEETQVIGLLAAADREHVAQNGLMILPGTHSKHVRVRQGAIAGLRTFMTGELYDVLCRHSVLRFTTDAGADAFDAEAFIEGVRAAKATGLAGSLFQVRTRGVLRGIAATANRSFLGGLLIGAELNEVVADETFPVLLAAAGPVASSYQLAAEELGLNRRLELVGADELKGAVIAGHRQLLERWQ
ncbi:MAG TPA: hypothetical protein DCY13_12480 [Verrucomicrobiales bacterium]|nr:hypothetical protein [Verrucomicrobiales bacterium]